MTTGGYNWAGCNWAGYDRNGWDRDGRNEWGQRRDHTRVTHAIRTGTTATTRTSSTTSGSSRTTTQVIPPQRKWDQSHGFNPNLYQNWNMNRDWHDPRNRDWAPLPTHQVGHRRRHPRLVPGGEP